MNSLLFLVSIIAIGMLMWWLITTDRAGRGDTADIGLFAMRAPPSPPTEPKATGGRRSTRT